MNKIDFRSSIQYEGETTFLQKIANSVENIGSLGGSTVYVITRKNADKSGYEVKSKSINQSQLEQVLMIVLKIALIVVFPLALIVLGLKGLHRATNEFQLISSAKQKEKTDEANEAERLDKSKLPKANKLIVDPVVKTVIKNTEPIDPKFTTNQSSASQISAHETAKYFLANWLYLTGATIDFISPPEKDCPEFSSVKIGKDLDENVFKWKITGDIGKNIEADGLRDSDDIIVYGVASQFNGCEAPGKYTVKPGNAVSVYKGDATQGPASQLQFPEEQVELINCAGNKGFNGLCYLVNETTKNSIEHGYFTPSEAQALELIPLLRTNGKDIEYSCVANEPINGEKEVHQILTAAPAFGTYKENSDITPALQQEIEFLCALQGFRAQFEKCVDLAIKKKKPVIFKPVAVGLGAFENSVEPIATAFYLAAKEYEDRLRESQVQVIFQVYRDGGKEKKLAEMVSLSQIE